MEDVKKSTLSRAPNGELIVGAAAVVPIHEVPTNVNYVDELWLWAISGSATAIADQRVRVNIGSQNFFVGVSHDQLTPMCILPGHLIGTGITVSVQNANNVRFFGFVNRILNY